MNQKTNYGNVDLKNGANLGIELFILQILGSKNGGHRFLSYIEYQLFTLAFKEK